ncbi:MAG: Histidine kinase [Marmoricola sp.]|jgi:signal transduction histidine kinase|nr:Histidine kinase [Marmoricola sp.]
MTDVGRVALAARVFTLAALGSITVVSNDSLYGLMFIVLVAIAMEVLSLTHRLPESWIAVAEGSITAIVAVAAFPNNDPVMPYLAIPAMLGGLSAGSKGLIRVMLGEAVSIAIAWWVIVGHYDAHMLGNSITWFATGIGLGILGRSVRSSIGTTTDASYRSALDLLKQLRSLSTKLTSGLDPVSLADRMMAQVAEDLPVEQSAIFLRSEGGIISPLRYSDGASPERFKGVETWIDACWEAAEPQLLGNLLAVPLQADSQVIAVLAMVCGQNLDPYILDDFRISLKTQALRLYTAILFDDVRHTATSEERQRLAREVHDGVAQDVASLGYLVDNLVAEAEDEQQSSQLHVLRDEVTRVVGELRHSVFDLRNEVGAGQGLGQSLSSFARHVGSHSDLTVHMRLDESASRLRPEVESELLRIAQEAMNNARKHSKGENLWVSCTVRPPHAEIEVLDDGLGMQEARPDSHGMRIMRERAERIGADLDVQTPAFENRGTRLRVRVGESS